MGLTLSTCQSQIKMKQTCCFVIFAQSQAQLQGYAKSTLILKIDQSQACQKPNRNTLDLLAFCLTLYCVCYLVLLKTIIGCHWYLLFNCQMSLVISTT